MLSYLLASHPQTTADTLTTIVNHPATLSPAMGAALTHPALPPDAPLPTDRKLGSSAICRVLACPRTTASRRARVLSWVYDVHRAALVRNCTDLTSDEIAALAANQRYLTPTFAKALARNPATPHEHLEPALRTLADDEHPATIAVFTEGRDLSSAFLAELTTVLVMRHGRITLTQFPLRSDDRTPTDRALASDLPVLRNVIEMTASRDLIVRALDAGLDVTQAVANALYRGTDNVAALAFADQLLPQPTLDDPTVLAEMTTPPVNLVGLFSMVTDPTLSPDTLTAIVATVLGAPVSAMGTTLLLQAAAHPSTPSDLLPALSERVHAEPAPGPSTTDAPGPELITHHLAVARVNGSTRPALDLPVPLVREYPDDQRCPTINTHQIRATVETHPGWPFTPTAAAALLTLEPTFDGTIRELLDTATAIAT